MSSVLSQNLDMNYPGSIGAEDLSIALIGPDAERRKAVADALAQCGGAEVREFSAYPPALDDVPRQLEEAFDVILIDLDSNPEYALELVESICVKDSATVMVYSAIANQEQLVRCMRAGAREYFDPPFDPSAVSEALARAAARLGRNMPERISAADKPLSLVSGGSPNAGAQPAIAWPTPTIAWPAPAPIVYGTALSAAQLNASASAMGTFVYTPGAGYVLPVGTHTLWVTFTPAGGDPVQHAVSITVAKVTPKIAWPAPRTIACGTPLSDAQLDAAATVPGTFVYSPAAGEVLGAGTHTLSVSFTPADFGKYTAAQAAVAITVAKAKPAISWPPPRPMNCGAALSGTELNAAASVPGTFVYSPAAGEVLGAGTHALSASFTPTDSERYTAAQATVTVTVAKAPLTIAWQPPEPITYGTALSTIQLKATASVPGTFVYSPGAGAVLAAGEHTPSVIFTPKDTAEYSASQVAVSLSVAMATPAISWPAPQAIPEGTPLGDAQLNATAPVSGTFVYSPARGEVLAAGVHRLAVTFTPADTMNYETARATVSLTVAERAPTVITWPAPAAIAYGTPLGAAELNATASVPGTFAYTPSPGVVLTAGKHRLSVTFTPADTVRYAAAQAIVELVVEQLADIDSLLAAASQTPFMQAGTANYADLAISPEWEEAASHNMPSSQDTPGRHDSANRESQRETRIYKGVIYEKGEDGQWHRQQK